MTLQLAAGLTVSLRIAVSWSGGTLFQRRGQRRGKGDLLCGFGGWIGQPVGVATRIVTFLWWLIRVKVGLFPLRGSGSQLDKLYLGDEVVDWGVLAGFVVFLHLGYYPLQALEFIVELRDAGLGDIYRFSY